MSNEPSQDPNKGFGACGCYAAWHRKQVIRGCDEHNEIEPLDDGYQYFWIKDRGAFSASDLRIIADELDNRNKDWDSQVKRDLSV